MRRLMTAAFAFSFVGIASLALADDKPNPTGTWKWTVTFGNQTREMTLKLKLDGDKLTGAMVREGKETPIQDAKYKDGDLTFNIVVEANGQKMVIKKTGKVSGDTIKGKTEFERDGQTQSREWEAKRVADPSGTWKWSATFRGETRERTLKLKLEGDKLTGAMLGRNGQETAIQDAKSKDGEVAFTVVRQRNGQKMTFKSTGKVSGDTMKGKTEFELDGQAQSVEWEAKRVKE